MQQDIWRSIPIKKICSFPQLAILVMFICTIGQQVYIQRKFKLVQVKFPLFIFNQFNIWPEILAMSTHLHEKRLRMSGIGLESLEIAAF